MAKNVNRKGLAILMRTKIKALPESRPASASKDMQSNSSGLDGEQSQEPPQVFTSVTIDHPSRILETVQKLMQGAIYMKKTDTVDLTLTEFSQGYQRLGSENRRKALFALATQFGVNRAHIRELMQHYLGLQTDDHAQQSDLDEEGCVSALYRTEKDLRHALKPLYITLFERLNAHPGGLKFLVDLRVDLNGAIQEENIPSLRSLDSDLKEKLATWLSPAVLELHRITWDDPASLLEKIVAYEAVHPISNLHDLKRRLGGGYRCFGYLHPAIPGEPLIFIEVALMRGLSQSIQEVLWDEPPIAESEATTALFYSISSTQRGLAGINLGKFLIKRVIELVRQEMPHVKMFATLSPIPGFMQWLLSKLASQSKLAQSSSKSSIDNGEALACTFRENLLLPEEAKAIIEATVETDKSIDPMEVLLKLLSSPRHEWTKSETLSKTVQPLLMRLCARYLLKEKKRGKALDPVTNFHVQNGATAERLNWMADLSEKGLCQSAGIMVNYLYRLDEIEGNLGRQVVTCDFVLDHPSVSRQHAAVVQHRNGSIYVIDLGSVHGTFVANERVTKDNPVELEIGQSLRFAASSRSYILRKNTAALLPMQQLPPQFTLPDPPDPSDEDAVVAYNTILNRFGASRIDLLPKTNEDSGALSAGGKDGESQVERASKRPRKARVAFRDQHGGELVEVVGTSDGADVSTEPGPIGVKEGSLVGKYESLVQVTVIPKGHDQAMPKEDSDTPKGVTQKLQQYLNKVKSPAKGGFYGDLYGDSFAGQVGASWANVPKENSGSSEQAASTVTTEIPANGMRKSDRKSSESNRMTKFQSSKSNALFDDDDDDLFGDSMEDDASR